MSLGTFVRNVGSAVTDTDIGAVRWIGPLRVALVTAGVVAISIALGHDAEALSLGTGALTAGVADQRGPIGTRIKAMTWMTAGVAIATTLGVLVSDWLTVRIVATMLVALVCGLLWRMGPRVGIAAQVSLVMFVVYAGAPAGAATAAPAGLIVLIGAGIQMAVAVASQAAGRTGGVRADICIAWRTAGHSLRRSRLRYGATSPVAKLEVARAGVRGMRADPSVTRPLEELIDAHAQFAVGGVIVLSVPFDGTTEQKAQVARVTHAAGDLAIAVGHAVEMPARASRMEAALARFEQAVLDAADLPDARMLTGIGEMRGGLMRAVEVVRAGVPRGGARSVPIAMSAARDPVRDLFGAVSFDDLIVRHAVRLSLAIGAGTLIALVAHFPHSSWAPMTVAWIMRPDPAGTVVSTLARLAGTIGGVVIVGLVVAFTGVSAVPVVVLVLVGSLVFSAFLLPNYAIATVGATAFIVAMFTFLGAPIITTADTRTYGTLIAGALALGATALIPPNTREVVCALLGQFAGELSAYAAQVRRAVPSAQRRAALESLTLARVAAGRVVEAAGHDARRHRIEPAEAGRMLRDLVQATAVVAADDLGRLAVPPERVVEDSADLARRLAARQADEPVPSRALPPAGPGADDAVQAVDDAQAALDRVLGPAPT